MRFTAALLPLAALGSVSDPCARLCQLDGPIICNDGSYNKNGVCHRYLFRGDPSLNDYCYHTSATASTCPSSGKPVKFGDAQRLVALKEGQRRDAVPLTTTTTTAAPPALRIDVLPQGGFRPAQRAVSTTTTTTSTSTTPRMEEDYQEAVATVHPFFAEMEQLMLEFGLTEEEALEDMMARDALNRMDELPRPEPFIPFRPAPPTQPAVDIPHIGTTQSPADMIIQPLHRRLVALKAETSARVTQNGYIGYASVDAERDTALIDSLTFLNGPVGSFLGESIYVKFKGEPGYGPGQTKEWMAEITRQIFSPDSGFFVLSDAAPLYYKINPRGLTRPRAREIYRAVGRFLGLSLLRNHPLGVNLPLMFFAKLVDHQLTLDEVSVEEHQLVESMRFILTLPADDLEDYPITIDGVDIIPTMQNRAELVVRKVNSLITPDVIEMFNLIKQGFNEVVPTARAGAIFRPAELKSLILGNPDIDIDDFFANSDIRFSNKSQLQWFRDILNGFTQEQRRKFLRFATNLTQTPVGGFARIEPKINISGGFSDAAGKMPRVYLCSHAMFIPDYKNEDEMREKLLLAIESGTGWK